MLYDTVQYHTVEYMKFFIFKCHLYKPIKKKQQVTGDHLAMFKPEWLWLATIVCLVW